jgi:hypothetical protein
MRNKSKRGIWSFSYIDYFTSDLGDKVISNKVISIKLYRFCVVYSPIAVKYVLSDKLVIFHGV